MSPIHSARLLCIVVGACTALTLSACKPKSTDTTPQNQATTPEIHPVSTQNTIRPISPLTWKGFENHPARAALESCHMLDDLDMMLLFQDAQEEETPTDYFDGYFDNKSRSDISQQLENRRAILASQPLCIEYLTEIDRYSDRHLAYVLTNNDDPQVGPDRTTSAITQVERIADEFASRIPTGFALPYLYGLPETPQYFPARSAHNDRIIKHLRKNSITVASSHHNRIDPNTILDDTTREIYLKHLSVLEKELDQTAEFFKKIYPTRATNNLARVISMVRPINTFKDTDRHHNAKITLRFMFLRPQFIVLALPDTGEVFAAIPEPSKTEKPTETTPVATTRPRDDEIMLAICDGPLQNHVETNLNSDGELIDTITHACRNCPYNDRRRHYSNKLEFEEIIYGSFTAPFADQAIVFTRGCQKDGNFSAARLVERTASGTWKHLRTGPYDLESCTKMTTPTGRDILVCLQDAHNEDLLRLPYVAARFDAQKTHITPLVIEFSNLFFDRDMHLVTFPEPTQTDLNNDGTPDLVFDVTFLHAPRKTPCEIPCGLDDDAPEPEKLRLEFIMQNDGLKISENTAANKEKIDQSFKN